MRRRALLAAAALPVVLGIAAGGPPAGFHQQGAKLTGRGEVHRGEFGWSVALSANGDTAAVGGSNDDSPTFDSTKGVLSQGLGAVWVFTRTGTTWRQQGTKLVGRGEVGPGQFGDAVALSADGDTLLVGAPADGGGAGAAWIFGRKGSVWKQLGGKLTSPGAGPSAFGTSVALSANGSTALIGGSFADGGIGAAWVLTRSGSRWTEQATLTGSKEAGTGQFGRRVALSADGATALVGAPGDDTGAGAAWAFTRSGSRWTRQGGKLTGGGADGEASFGSAVALSADGATALVGGSVDANGMGSAWTFTRSGSSWKQDGKKLTAAGETGPGQFGDSVALSADGGLVLVGAAVDGGGAGAAWAFRRTGTGWSQLGKKLVGRGATGMPVNFGESLALSSSGTTALIGGLGDADAIGAAWVFER